MKNIATLFLVSFALLVNPAGPGAQLPEIGESNVRPIPEIKRLYQALAGDWDTGEKRERTQFFPNGGERKGRVHTRLAAGGAMLVMEGHSDGSAGPLSYITVVWWDKDADHYGFFICFKATDTGCKVRGSAHWDGDKFVNDYEEVVDGKKFRFRDTFQDITPNSYTLVFAWVKDDGPPQPVIITKAVRRS
ncbi:MAG TPA: hypothetical protein VGF61_13335 [Candidatus Acidoferrum sp.]|jgi:hypothetical protein